MEARCPYCFLASFIYCGRVNVGCEYWVRSATFSIHSSSRDMPSFLALLDQVHNFFDASNMCLGAVLQVSCALFVFPDVKFSLLKWVKQVKDILVIDFDVRAFDRKLDLGQPFSFEYLLVVKVLSTNATLTIRLIRVTFQVVPVFDFAHLSK